MPKPVKLRRKPRIPAPPESVQREYVDIPTAAATVSVSAATIRRQLTKGTLKRYKFGARTLIRVSELMGQIKSA